MHHYDSFFGSFSQVYQATKSIGLKAKTLALIFLLKILVVLSEILGFAIFGPLLEFIESDRIIPSDSSFAPFWRGVQSVFSSLHLEITFGSLITSLLLILFFRQLIGFAHLFITSVLKAGIQKSIIDRSVGLALHSNLDFVQSNPRGEFINDINKESDRLILGVFKAVNLVCNLILLLVYSVFLYFVVGNGVILVLVACVATAFALNPVLSKSRLLSAQITGANRQTLSKVLLILDAIRLIKLSGRENDERSQVHEITSHVYNGTKRLAFFQAALTYSIEPIVMSVGAAFVYVSIEQNNTPIAELAVVFLSLVRLLPVVKEILPGIQSVMGVQASTMAVQKIIRSLSDNQEDITKGDRLNSNFTKIKFENISFKYNQNENFLFNNLTAEFSLGAIYCVTGRSGIGKSTLIDLIPKLRTPTKGEIYIGSQNLDNISRQSIRQQIAFGSCEPSFLSSSIKNFLEVDEQNCSTEDIFYVFRALDLEDWITSLPQGINTVISDQATEFSSGQKQRLELARILLSSKRVIIFDEPTTNLDQPNITRFLEFISNQDFRRNKIIIMVSHDPMVMNVSNFILDLEVVARH